jgi:hypothetical protein
VRALRVRPAGDIRSHQGDGQEPQRLPNAPDPAMMNTMVPRMTGNATKMIHRCFTILLAT